MKKKRDIPEIVSLNQELLSFDAADVNLEVLERRLEMAVIFCGMYCGDFGCHGFSGCNGFMCGRYEIITAQ